MERNTFSVSSYIAAPPEMVYDYLCDLQNLDEWTLFSRMKEKVDDRTWIGTASGYQRDLVYHVRTSDAAPLRSVEWHCGFERGDYFQVYPVVLFEPGYIEPGSAEPGVYLHWVSFVDPSRRTAMIEQGISDVHAAECRALKAALERRVGRREWVAGRASIKTATIYIDAPVELGLEYLGDLRNMAEWAHLLRPRGDCGREAGSFTDEYEHPVEVSLRAHAEVGASASLIEHDLFYPGDGLTLRAPSLVVPCSKAFGAPGARGFILQRITFWDARGPRRRGKLAMQEHRAELINIKRFLEARAGNREAFSRGTSYLPLSSASRGGS